MIQRCLRRTYLFFSTFTADILSMYRIHPGVRLSIIDHRDHNCLHSHQSAIFPQSSTVLSNSQTWTCPFWTSNLDIVEFFRLVYSIAIRISLRKGADVSRITLKRGYRKDFDPSIFNRFENSCETNGVTLENESSTNFVIYVRCHRLLLHVQHLKNIRICSTLHGRL